MASSKPSKAERQRRNRAQRDARRARSAHAGEATEIAKELGDGGATSSDESKATADAGVEKGAKATKAAGGATRRGRRQNPYSLPGQRAVTMALVFSIASIALLIFLNAPASRTVEPDDPRVEQADSVENNEDGTVTIVEQVSLLDDESLPVALYVLLAPVAVTGAAVYFAKHEKRSTIWTMAMLGMAAYVWFLGFVTGPESGQYAIYALPALVALGVGGFQTRRAENAERVAELKAQRAARKAAKAEGKDVIDVDPVDEDDD